jgi:hypothetical protein
MPSMASRSPTTFASSNFSSDAKAVRMQLMVVQPISSHSFFVTCTHVPHTPR